MPNSILNKIKLPDNTIVEINDNRIIVGNPQSEQILSYDSINNYWTNNTINNVIPGYQDANVGDIIAKTQQGIKFVTPSEGGIMTLTSPVRIWDLVPGLYILPPLCTVYYNGASSSTNFIVYGGILNVYYGYSNTLKRWDCWGYNGNTSSLTIPNNRYAGSTTSSNGNYTTYRYMTSQRGASNLGSYDFGHAYYDNLTNFNTISTNLLASGSCRGYMSSSCSNKPVNLTLPGSTYFHLFVHNSYSNASYISVSGYYIRQDLFLPTLNKHYYRLIQCYNSTVTPNTSITGADSAGWVELLESIPSLTGNAGKVMKVNSSETGVEWGNATAAISELTDVNLGTLANGDILQYNSSTLKWVNSPFPSGTVPSPTTDDTCLYSPDGTIFGWYSISSITRHDYKHQRVSFISVSGSQTITYIENTRGSQTIKAHGNLILDFIVNNGADNILWIINNAGSTIDIAIGSVISNNETKPVFLPENGIDVGDGYVCEIGVIVNIDGAYITVRNDLVLQIDPRK